MDQNQVHKTIHGVMLIASSCGGKFMRTHLSSPSLSVRVDHGDVNCDAASHCPQWIHQYSASLLFVSW